MMMIHKNIHVKGNVQGVSYRISTFKTALKYGLKGFVRNEPDGSVYVEIEGEDSDVHQFINWCRRGPELAEVQELDAVSGELRHFEDFKIRR